MMTSSDLNDISNKIFTKERISRLKQYFIMMCISIMCTFLIMSLSKPRVGTVNISKIINDYITIQSKIATSPIDLQVKVKLFNLNLEKIINDFSTKKHMVLLSSNAVISQSNDYTKEIQDLMSKINIDEGLLIQNQMTKTDLLSQTSSILPVVSDISSQNIVQHNNIEENAVKPIQAVNNLQNGNSYEKTINPHNLHRNIEIERSSNSLNALKDDANIDKSVSTQNGITEKSQQGIDDISDNLQ